MKVNDENSRIQIYQSEAWIPGSGSTPKSHGSAKHCYQDTEKAREESVYYALMFGLLGLGSTVATFLQGLMFGISGKLAFLFFRKNAVTISVANP